VGESKVASFKWREPDIEQFPHIIRARYYENGVDKLRMITWLNTYEQELHRDFEVANKDGFRLFYFKDPDVASLFKLTWVC
jgi:hypothetical protein